jgi:hypothetical protein
MRIGRGDGSCRGRPCGGESADQADATIRHIPYAFARRHGLVSTGEVEGRPDIAMREGADPNR